MMRLRWIDLKVASKKVEIERERKEKQFFKEKNKRQNECRDATC